MFLLLAESAAIGSDSTITLALAIVGGSGLLALGSWSAILRHRQDDHGRRLNRVEDKVKELEDEKIGRDAVRDYRARHPSKRTRRADSDAPRRRPEDSHT